MYKEFLRAYIKACNDLLSYGNEPLLFKAGEDLARSLEGKAVDEVKDTLGFGFTHEKLDERLVFTVAESIEAEVAQNATRPVCFMLQGFFTGLSKEVFRSGDVRCEEVKCRAMGNGTCVFEVKGPKVMKKERVEEFFR